MTIRKINIAKTLMSELLSNLRILDFYLKIKEIFYWINVIIVKKKTYVLFIANLNILLKTTIYSFF